MQRFLSLSLSLSLSLTVCVCECALFRDALWLSFRIMKVMRMWCGYRREEGKCVVRERERERERESC